MICNNTGEIFILGLVSKKCITEDTPIIHDTPITNKRGRPKKGAQLIIKDIPKKSKGRPRLDMTNEEKLIRHREITSKWQKENRELSSKFSSECSKKGRDAIKILKDLVTKNLIPASHSQTVNELFIYKKISI